jgi:hypothetical protein
MLTSPGGAYVRRCSCPTIGTPLSSRRSRAQPKTTARTDACIQPTVRNAKMVARCKRKLVVVSGALALLAFLFAGSSARGQQPAPSSGSVSSPQENPKSNPEDPKSTKPAEFNKDRIFGVIPNYRTVEIPTQHIQPLSTKDKFRLAVADSFDIYAYPIAGIFAAVGQAQNDPTSWGQGWGAFGKRFAASFTDQTSENMMTEAVLPSLLKQDPRYFRMGQGSFFKRTGYAVSRIWVTRMDSGGKMFNFSEILGAGASSGISNAYYPPENRTLSKNLSRWGILVGEDTLFNILKEYWPDMKQKLFKK